MSGNDRKKTARRVNPESPWRIIIAVFCNYLLELLEAHVAKSAPPAIVRDGVYTREQVMKNLRLSAHTLNRWKDGGLRWWDGGEKREFFRGEDLLIFMGKDEPLPPAYKSPHVERNAERKRKGA